MSQKSKSLWINLVKFLSLLRSSDRSQLPWWNVSTFALHSLQHINLLNCLSQHAYLISSLVQLQITLFFTFIFTTLILFTIHFGLKKVTGLIARCLESGWHFRSCGRFWIRAVDHIICIFIGRHFVYIKRSLTVQDTHNSFSLHV